LLQFQLYKFDKNIFFSEFFFNQAFTSLMISEMKNSKEYIFGQIWNINWRIFGLA